MRTPASIDRSVGIPTVAWLFAAAVAATLAVASTPGNGLLALTATAGMLGIFWAAAQPVRWVFVLLAAKPLVDLTWRWRFFTVFEQEVNLQSAIGVFVIGFTGLVVAFRWTDIKLPRLYWIFLASAVTSVFLAPSSQGLNELIRLIAGASFFITAGYVLHDRRTFERFACVFLIAVLIPVMLSFAQLAGLLPFEYWDWLNGAAVGRVTGTYQHPLSLIYFLIYAIPLALYLLEANQRHPPTALLAATFIGLSGVALVFTYHRTGLFTILLMYLLWLLYTRRYALVIASVIAGAVLSLAFADWVGVLYRNLIDIIRGDVEFASPDFLRGRGTNFYLFLNSYWTGGPLTWLFGRGASIAEGIVPVFGLYMADEPHNDFIRILHAYGLVGLGLYLALLWSFFLRARVLRGRKDTFSHLIGTMMILVLFAVMMLSLTGEPLRYPTGVWYLFALGAVVTRLHRTGVEEARRSTTLPSHQNPDIDSDQ